MALAQNVITIIKSSIFDLELLEDGRPVITSAATTAILPDEFVDGAAEMPVLFASNSILIIRQENYTVDLENLPDNLEFIRQEVNVLFFVIKGDCDIPLIPVQHQEMV